MRFPSHLEPFHGVLPGDAFNAFMLMHICPKASILVVFWKADHIDVRISAFYQCRFTKCTSFCTKNSSREAAGYNVTGIKMLIPRWNRTKRAIAIFKQKDKLLHHPAALSPVHSGKTALCQPRKTTKTRTSTTEWQSWLLQSCIIRDDKTNYKVHC